RHNQKNMYARPTNRKPLQHDLGCFRVKNAIVMAMIPVRQRREARSLERLPIYGLNIHAVDSGWPAL
ncbi:hypothetical protein, partial [Arthrobacter nitrophenolicus]|uniref:hypothetical protein n=1 Tax=Arthrobacter nitrophenolicus TaxID=683150 RepID=UPI001F3C4B80